MNILIGLIPALFWGILPIFVNKIGGKPINQIIGTTYGTLLVAVVSFFIVPPTISTAGFWAGLASGVFWAFGQMLQYTAFTQIGVTKAMPVSTGMQLVGTSLMGVIIFGEWPATTTKILGFISILIIIVGIYMTTKEEVKSPENNAETKAGIITLLISTIGYVGYSFFPRLVPTSDGWSAFLPQALGMALAATIFSFIGSNRKAKALKDPISYKNMGAGFIFSIAAIGYLISTQRNGIATGFTLSQMNVVVATLSGIFILGEKKTKKELIYITVGLVLVIAGGLTIGLMK